VFLTNDSSLISVSNVLSSHTSVLLDFNQGQNTHLSGWDWQDDITYGNKEWVLMR
jgi:hypothetical protein|tara:strand:- start:126 stop:290 length:165 start_codon:yes stop_codon:yes gene_type:complete